MQRARSFQFALAVMLVPAVLATGSAQAQTYTEKVLYSFKGGTDGAYPSGGLLRDAPGNLYGNTAEGGDPACTFGGEPSCGTVFKVDTTGKETVLYSFTGTGGDGSLPLGGLVQDAQGNLYGATWTGGDFACFPAQGGCGTLFKVDTTDKETVLYSFTGYNIDPMLADGANPNGGLVLGVVGGLSYLFGTTNVGGVYGYGTVFFWDLRFQYEGVMYSFPGQLLGKPSAYPQAEAYPQAGLVQDAQGNLYGTTNQGGVPCGIIWWAGCGTVFKVDTSGKETVLYSFTGTRGDGAYPTTALVLDEQGNLYGTTGGGGTFGHGTVFKVDTIGHETVLHSFTGTGLDGGGPSGLVRDAQGNLYGTTSGGGTSGWGTVFKVDTTGHETVLYSFTGTGGDGANPTSGVVRDAQGNLYGTTYEGGTSDYGTVFKLTRVPGIAGYDHTLKCPQVRFVV